MNILNTGDFVGGYRIQSLIKQNEYTETYKAVNANEQPYFLKLYVMKRTPAKLIDSDSHEVLEIALLQKIQHVNVISHIAHGSFDTSVGECQYLVTNYFTGDVLADKIAREGRIEPDKAVTIFMGGSLDRDGNHQQAQTQLCALHEARLYHSRPHHR